MASDPKPPDPKPPAAKTPAQDKAAQDKAARLAQALRANLGRRKAQGRARRDVEQDPGAADQGPPIPDVQPPAPPSPADPAPDDATSGGLEPAIIVPKGAPC